MEQEPRFRVGDFTRKGIKSNFCPLASARGSGMRHDELLECRRRGLAWFFHTVTSRTSQFSHLTRGGMTDCLGQDSSASSSRALPPSLIHSVPFSCSISPEPQSSPDTSSQPVHYASRCAQDKLVQCAPENRIWLFMFFLEGATLATRLGNLIQTRQIAPLRLHLPVASMESFTFEGRVSGLFRRAQRDMISLTPGSFSHVIRGDQCCALSLTMFLLLRYAD